MFQLGKTIVSEDIIEKDFVCNLNACKGKCCIDGEAGAPLEESELQILLDIYPARELPLDGITSSWLLSKMKNKKINPATLRLSA